MSSLCLQRQITSGVARVYKERGGRQVKRRRREQSRGSRAMLSWENFKIQSYETPFRAFGVRFYKI